MESQSNNGQATGYSATYGVQSVVTFHVEPVGLAPYAGQLDLGNWQAVLTKTRRGKLGDTEVYSQSQDVTSLLNQLRGHLQVDSDGATLQQCSLTLTNWGSGVETQGLLRVRTEIHAEFQPHAAPAEVQDSHGYGMKVVYNAGVPQMDQYGASPGTPMVREVELPGADNNEIIDAMGGII